MHTQGNSNVYIFNFFPLFVIQTVGSYPYRAALCFLFCFVFNLTMCLGELSMAVHKVFPHSFFPLHRVLLYGLPQFI